MIFQTQSFPGITGKDQPFLGGYSMKGEAAGGIFLEKSVKYPYERRI